MNQPNYQLHVSRGHQYVVTDNDRPNELMGNFNNTGLYLAGELLGEDTLDEFILRQKQRDASRGIKPEKEPKEKKVYYQRKTDLPLGRHKKVKV